MQVEFKMRYINHWIDDLGPHRYRFRREGFPGVELPVDSDPNGPWKGISASPVASIRLAR